MHVYRFDLFTRASIVCFCRLTVGEMAEEVANIANAMVVALVDSSVERLKEKNEDYIFVVCGIS